MNCWDTRYQGDDYIFGTAPNEFLASVVAAGHLPPGPVLCLGAGEGRNAVYLAQQGHAVTALDMSPVGLAKARKLADQRGVSISTVVADLAAYTIEPGAWAGITSIFLHPPPPLRQQLYRQVVAGLAPGGVLVLEGYTPRQLVFRTGGPPDPALLLTLADLHNELADLEPLIAHERERPISEGRGHSGPSSVVQFVGRKGG